MPIPTKTAGKGRSGIAMVSIQGDKVKVVFEDNDQVVTCLLEDCPSYIRPGRQAITLNSSNTAIYGARPVGGTFKAQFVGFASRENEPPTIREVAARSGVSQAGKKYNIKAHLEFTALFDIVSGKWKNYRLVYNLPYGFERYDSEDTDKPTTLVYGGKLAEFLALCGVDFESDTIPFSDNVLVYLEKLLRSRSRTITISLNDQGWVKDIGELPEDDEPEEEQPEPTKPTKADADKAAEELFGSATPSEERIKELDKKKPNIEGLGILDVIARNAKDGDQDAIRMLTALAAKDEKAKAKLEEIMNGG